MLWAKWKKQYNLVLYKMKMGNALFATINLFNISNNKLFKLFVNNAINVKQTIITFVWTILTKAWN